MHVSTALIDGKIFNHEVQLVLSEVSKYHQIKDEIWTMTQKAHVAVVLAEETQNSLIQRG